MKNPYILLNENPTFLSFFLIEKKKNLAVDES